MPIQTYYCAIHKEMFEIQVPFSQPHPPETSDCPLGAFVGQIGRHTGSWRPSVVNFIVKEGTGAFKRSSINHD